ncbi:MAG: cation-translocating P-type ATPase [Acutalibacteraceae bacterium]|nr:cation-translocating P-type ATPase [Acutalibacteraceae bacterium]
MIWHSTASEEILRELEVDDKKGLPNGVADMRLKEYGRNVIARVERPTYFKRFLGQLKSKTVIALIVISLLSFAVSLMYNEADFFAPLLIIAIVLINAAVSAYHLHNCDNALDSMKSITNPSVTVMREGIVRTVDSSILVPGDIILLETGDFISADARIIESNEFRCNESMLTGDEVPVEKSGEGVYEDITAIENRLNMVFSGTSVVHGNAKAVVVATGLNTEIGRTSAILQQTGEKTLPLEGELDGIGKIVNIIILSICLIVFIIGMVLNFNSGNFASTTLKMLMNAVALAVAAIPEGLPAIATIVIAIGIKRIVEDKIIIKDSEALEWLGKTNVICADKTGVLTRNKMKLAKIFDGDKLTDIENEPIDEKTALVLKLATACSTLNNDSTEDAIKKACLAYNSMSEKDIESFFPKLAVIPFDSERKTMTVITMINERPFAIVKGAPEIVVPNCVGCKAEEILKLNSALCNDALRIVAIAIRPLDNIPANPNPEDIEHSLTFVGLLGLYDPPRDNVVEDIKICEQAGIKTVMITGDNLATACSVASKIGILKDGDKAVTGEELSGMSDEELAEKVSDFSVYARVSPNDKLRIVKALQQAGNVVTITGDSVQDADALAAADVGCAIGKFGADVAKGSADIVISNNRFESILCAVKESRGLFDNIKKSVYYLLSCNFAELITILFGMIIFGVAPLAAVQLLWINLLTDCAPAISLSMERAEDSAMRRNPYTALGKIFDLSTVVSIIIQSAFIAVMTLIAYGIGVKDGGAAAMTMAFAVLGMSQIFHCFNSKLEGTLINKRLFSNRFLNFAAALTLFVIIFLVLTPAGYLFGMTTLSFGQFMLSLLLSFLILPLCEAIKLVKRIILK